MAQCKEECSHCQDRCTFDAREFHKHDCGEHPHLSLETKKRTKPKKKAELMEAYGAKSVEQSLYERLIRALTRQQGMCLDEEAERIAVAVDLTRLLTGVLKFKPKLSKESREEVERWQKDYPGYKLL